MLSWVKIFLVCFIGPLLAVAFLLIATDTFYSCQMSQVQLITCLYSLRDIEAFLKSYRIKNGKGTNLFLHSCAFSCLIVEPVPKKNTFENS